MQFKGDIQVERIPLSLLDLAWPLAVHCLRKGALACGETTLQMLVKLVKRDADLWIVIDRPSQEIVAAFLTGIHTETDTGLRFVCAYGLGGQQPGRWVGSVQRAVVDFARNQACQAVRIAGSRAWLRLFRGFQPIPSRLGDDPAYQMVIK